MALPKAVKTTFLVLVLIIVSVAVAVTKPWTYIHYIPGIGTNCALTVNTTSGRAEVFLDDKKLGETPFSTESLKPGDFTLRLVRISDNETFYQPIERKIHLEPNTRTFVESEIGPDQQFSSFKLVYYQKNTKDSSPIYVNSTPEGSTVWIDDVRYGDTPVTSRTVKAGQHTLKVVHDGYVDSEVSILARDGYTLIVEIELMAKPVELQPIQ